MRRFCTLVICVLLVQTVKVNKALAFQSAGYRADTTALLPIKEVAESKYQNVIYKRRLDSVQKDVPLDYNQFVQGYIDNYMGRRDEMSRIIGLSKYYFPIYEKAFREAGIPDEIKYLSIVESALNPNAVSRVGAAGPWQFMSETAKIYNLKMTDYVDERRDPIQASQAAAAYLKDAYMQFGDWLLAIASYNCGKSNVQNAMERTGANDYWSIRQYLPAETRGYVPAYIAISYVMNYYQRHNITPQSEELPLQTDTLMVNRFVPMSRIASALGLDLKDMVVLNPSYRQLIVNGTSAAPRKIVVPVSRKERFAILAQAIDNPNMVIPPYRPVYTPPPAPPKPVVVQTVAQVKTVAPAIASDNTPVATAPVSNLPAYHTTIKGDSLGSIATKYGLRVEDLMQWNKQLGNNKNIPLVAGLSVSLHKG
jgi:membrane-bound lytic murein transglycosylase D